VRKIIDSRAAAIHADFLSSGVQRNKLLHGAR
jgi:hypothetical protein